MPNPLTPESLKFLKALARNNRRDWFLAHKARYEEVLRQPCLALIADLQAPLRKISAHYVADPRPAGGSLFRIHRDTRFSGDKTPYKTHAGMRFFHDTTIGTVRADDGGAGRGRLDAPVFYLHIEPGRSFMAAASGTRSRRRSSASAITSSPTRAAGRRRRGPRPLSGISSSAANRCLARRAATTRRMR